MKKAKRFLTGLLSAVMALSLCAMPAMAATPDDVWTRETGSITIHKYEYNGKDAKDSTGEATDVNNLPEGAKALEGATFSIYKVKDRRELRAYYNGNATNPEAMVTVDTYLNDEKDGIKAGQSYSNPVDVATTTKEGLATFNGLELGLYVVVETGTPDKVTSPVKPFLVSVPMTKASNPSEWLYDIHVYPKNGTTYGEVKIVKTGRVGSNEVGKLEGVTFTLEKYNEKTKGWDPVTNSEADGTAFDLKTDNKGEISVSGLSQGTYRFIEQSIDGNNTYIIDQTPIVFEVTTEGKIVYNGGEAKEAVEIPVINEKPDIEKNVIDKNGDLKTDTDYSVGDHVPYQITVTVPKNITKLKTFTVTDTPTNLIFDGVNDNFKVQYGVKGEDGTVTYQDVDTGAYTVTTDTPKNGFTVAFKPDQMEAYAGQEIIIKYTATLQSTADQTTVGNPNTASLKYTNKIGVDSNGNPTEVDKKEIHDDTVVYTFKVRVLKVNDTQEALAGVKFDLYKEDPEGTVTDDTARALGLDPEKHWTKVNAEPLVSGKDGYLEQGGLANGEYYLVETETVSGYNLLKAPVKVTLSIQETTTWTETNIYDDQGNLLKHTVTKKTTKFTGGDKENSGEYTITVINRKGFDLPVTGGFGTLLFSGIGVLLVVAGVGVLLSLKKKNRA